MPVSQLQVRASGQEALEDGGPCPVKPSALVCSGRRDLLAVQGPVCVCSPARATPSGCSWGSV